MVFCRGCGKEIHETAVSCPRCGAVQYDTAKSPQNQSGTLWLPVPLFWESSSSWPCFGKEPVKMHT